MVVVKLSLSAIDNNLSPKSNKSAEIFACDKSQSATIYQYQSYLSRDINHFKVIQ